MEYSKNIGTDSGKYEQLLNRFLRGVAVAIPQVRQDDLLGPARTDRDIQAGVAAGPGGRELESEDHQQEAVGEVTGADRRV